MKFLLPIYGSLHLLGTGQISDFIEEQRSTKNPRALLLADWHFNLAGLEKVTVIRPIVVPQPVCDLYKDSSLYLYVYLRFGLKGSAIAFIKPEASGSEFGQSVPSTFLPTVPPRLSP